MTKEITKAFVIQQITDKLGLRELVPERFAFSELVVPIYNIEPHLKTYISNYIEKSITSATGFQFFKVPENQLWCLERYTVIFMGAGGFTVSGVYIKRANELVASAMYLDLTAGQSVSYANDLPKSVVLSPGDELYILVDGYTSTQALRLYIDYTREEIR